MMLTEIYNDVGSDFFKLEEILIEIRESPVLAFGVFDQGGYRCKKWEGPADMPRISFTFPRLDVTVQMKEMFLYILRGRCISSRKCIFTSLFCPERALSILSHISRIF